MLLSGSPQIRISLSNVGFVPVYGGDLRHKVLALFAPEDQLTGSSQRLCMHSIRQYVHIQRVHPNQLDMTGLVSRGYIQSIFILVLCLLLSSP